MVRQKRRPRMPPKRSATAMGAPLDPFLSMMRAAVLALSVSRHQITPLVITSLAVSLDKSLPFATPLTVMSRSVTIPIEPVVLADRNDADIVLSHFLCKRPDWRIR